MTRDTLFRKPLGPVPDFSFDAAVARVFTDMIERSVPGYATVVETSGLLAAEFSREGSRLYDLGCSLGGTSIALARRCAPGCRVIAVDNSAAMIDKLRNVLGQLKSPLPIELRCEDICQTSIEHASFIALNYTLQFVPRERRDKLLESVFNGMLEGGAMVLSEKIAFTDPEEEALFTRMHHHFKAANGYSEIEISQKRDALENVLVPETLHAHRRRLQAVGFRKVETWFQCFNFVSLLAIK